MGVDFYWFVHLHLLFWLSTNHNCPLLQLCHRKGKLCEKTGWSTVECLSICINGRCIKKKKKKKSSEFNRGKPPPTPPPHTRLFTHTRTHTQARSLNRDLLSGNKKLLCLATDTKVFSSSGWTSVSSPGLWQKKQKNKKSKNKKTLHTPSWSHTGGGCTGCVSEWLWERGQRRRRWLGDPVQSGSGVGRGPQTTAAAPDSNGTKKKRKKKSLLRYRRQTGHPACRKGWGRGSVR